MPGAFRRRLAILFNPDLGVLGERVTALEDAVAALSDRFSRAQKGRRDLMGTPLDPQAAERLAAFLKAPGGNGSGNLDFM